MNLLTVSEVAKMLRVDATTVRRWIASGALASIHLPARGKRQSYRIAEATVRALLGLQELPEEV